MTSSARNPHSPLLRPVPLPNEGALFVACTDTGLATHALVLGEAVTRVASMNRATLLTSIDAALGPHPGYRSAWVDGCDWLYQYGEMPSGGPTRHPVLATRLLALVRDPTAWTPTHVVTIWTGPRHLHVRERFEVLVTHARGIRRASAHRAAFRAQDWASAREALAWTPETGWKLIDAPKAHFTLTRRRT